MNRVFIKSIIIVFLFIISHPIYGESSSELSLKVFRTKIFKLQNINADQQIKNKIDESLLKTLGKINHLKELPDDKICYDGKKAIEEGKNSKANFAVFGKITRNKKLVDRRPLGNEGKEQYVIKNTYADVYHIELFFVSIHGKKITHQINEKVLLPEVDGILNKFKSEIEKSYTLDFESNREISIPQIETIKVEPKKKIPTQEVIKVIPVKLYISTGITYLQPFGLFQKLAVNPFIGPIVNLGIRNLIFENSIINLNFSYSFLTQNTYFINLYNIASLGIGVGYYFQLPKKFNISPILSGGYTFHLYKDVFSSEIETFYDPFVKLECEVGYSFNKTISIYLTPGFTLFFEKTLAGYYLTVDLGIKFTF